MSPDRRGPNNVPTTSKFIYKKCLFDNRIMPVVID